MHSLLFLFYEYDVLWLIIFIGGRNNMEDILQMYGDMTGCGPFNFQEPLESMQVNHHQAPPPPFENVSFNPHQILEAAGSIQQPIILEESLNFNSQIPNGQNMVTENGIEEIEQGWQRIRWTNEMVKILITAVCYYDDVVSVEGSDFDWNHLLTPIKGKWRSVSRALVERGFLVSPQQCEDKFNDLNKKYKRLIQILGTDTSYNVVENPTIMEGINIPDESKDEVRKILTCKQLFFKEMYSYHSKNHKFLPHDAPLQKSMLAILTDTDHVTSGSPLKKRKPGQANGNLTDFTNILPGAMEEQELSELLRLQSLELEEKRLQIQMKMLKLEKKKFEWLKSCRHEDEELQQMMLDNKLMQLENERQAFMLKCRKRGTSRN